MPTIASLASRKPATSKPVRKGTTEIAMLCDDGSILAVVNGSKVAAIAKAHGVNAVRKAVIRIK
jgi:hypothetical protein